MHNITPPPNNKHNIILQTIESADNIEFYNNIHLAPLGNIHSELHTVEYLQKHRHDFYEIIYCLSGNFSHYYYENYRGQKVDRYNSVQAASGTVLIVPPNCVHYFEFSKNENEPVSYINIQVGNKTFSNLTSVLKLTKLQNKFSSMQCRTRYFDVESFFENIYTNDNYSIKQLAQLNYILLTNILSSSVLLNNNVNLQPDWFKNITIKLNNPNNYNKSLKSLAKFSGYSYSQLSKLFKQTAGISLCSYFIRSKMRYASYLLKNTNWKIIDISLILGYNNCSFFSKTFFKHFNATPQEYRNKFHPKK